MGIVTSVSVKGCKRATASRAFCWRLPASKVNGTVTKDMLGMSSDLAMRAAIWMAPEPVPPPMPAVRNSRSQSRMAAINSR